jgi:formylglycine-generating enzyme required for sulfatase activity
MSDNLHRLIAEAMAQQAPRISLGQGESAMTLLRVPAGSFVMGAPPQEPGRLPGDGPQRVVTLTQPFYLGSCPVTQAQYHGLTGEMPARQRHPETAMDQLRFADALQFCERLAQQLQWPVRLPTQAQWEYACRAGTTTRFWSGDDEASLARVAWYRANAGGHAHEVGQRPANPWGFFDMLGNVCEYCHDTLAPHDAAAVTDPVGTHHLAAPTLRGGGWMHSADYCRCAMRLPGSDMFGGAGLRVLLPVAPA